jgi:hypothetical protein
MISCLKAHGVVLALVLNGTSVIIWFENFSLVEALI